MPPAQRWKPRRWRSRQEFGGSSLRSEDLATRVYAWLLKAAAEPVGNYDSLVEALGYVRSVAPQDARDGIPASTPPPSTGVTDQRNAGARRVASCALLRGAAALPAAHGAVDGAIEADPTDAAAMTHWADLRTISTAVRRGLEPGEGAILGWPIYATPWCCPAREREAWILLERARMDPLKALPGLAALVWLQRHLSAPERWAPTTWERIQLDWAAHEVPGSLAALGAVFRGVDPDAGGMALAVQAAQSGRTKPSPKPRQPTAREWQAYRLVHLFGMSGEDAAAELKRDGCGPCSEAFVSRARRRVAAWVEAGGVLPEGYQSLGIPGRRSRPMPPDDIERLAAQRPTGGGRRSGGRPPRKEG